MSGHAGRRVAAPMSLLVAVGLLSSCAAGAVEPVNAQSAGSLPTVLVELFTSEGCSSCPPADEALSRLVTTQPIEGVEIVALGEHVDYWDRLGWRDRFSSREFTERQMDYQAKAFPSSAVYTPQAVVDGVHEGIGSDSGAVRRAVLLAARAEKADVRVELVDETPRRVRVAVDIVVPSSLQRRGAADVVVALTQDGLVSKVARGENQGRTLSHSAVVRSFTTLGQVGGDELTFSGTAAVSVDSDWPRRALRVVAFVQERDSRRVYGVAGARLSELPASQ